MNDMDATTQTTNTNDPSAYLAPGRYVDSDHPAVIAFARRVADPGLTPREIAVKLYYAVRDEFLYDPYYFDTTVEGLKGSHVIEAGRGFCVPKATLLAATARVLGVPARVAYADVRNRFQPLLVRESRYPPVGVRRQRRFGLS